MDSLNIVSLEIFKTMVNLLVIVLNNLKEDDQFEGINYLLVSINGFKKSIKWYAKRNNNIDTELVTVQNSTERPYGISLAKFLSNCRTIFEPNVNKNKDLTGLVRLNNKLVRIKTSQVSEMIHHMFDGVGSNNNTGTIARILNGKSPRQTPSPPRTLPSICDVTSEAVTISADNSEKSEKWNASDNDDDDDDESDTADLDDSLDHITSSISATSDAESLLGGKKVRLKNDFERGVEIDGPKGGEPKRTKRKMDSFNCFQCPKSYRKRKSLILHYKQHPGFCHDCGVYRGLTTPEIVAHNQNVHIKKFPCICELCGDSFSRNQQYQVHLVLHAKEPKKSYACPECGEKFPLMALYKKHLSQKNHKGHFRICEICGASFDGNERLAQHLLRTHRKEATLKCGHCEMRFAIKDNLKRHERMHLEVEKMFVCEHCGSEYFTNSALKDHYTSAHTNIRPFECEICKKRFIHQRSLRKHAQSHSDERPFSCNLCEQAFKHKTHLVRHKQMVHSEAPAKKKIKRLQENQNGELVPVDEFPRVKTSKATVSSSNTSKSTITTAAAIPTPSPTVNNKQFQPFSDNNHFFSKGKQIQFTSTGVRGAPQHPQQTIIPPVSRTEDHQLLDFVHNAAQPIHHQQANHIMNQQSHHPQQQHQPNQQIQQLHQQQQQSHMGPQQQQHHQLQQLHHQQMPIRQRHHQIQPQHPQHHPSQRPSSQQQPQQQHPQHSQHPQHHPSQRQLSQQPQQHQHHQQQQHHHQQTIQTSSFDANLSNVGSMENSLFQQSGFQPQESQYFKFSSYNHQSNVNVPLPAVPPPNDPMYNRTGAHNMPYEMLVEPNNWNITDNTTTALNVAAASADIDSKDNKMFSLLEMGSTDFMQVDMPQFGKPGLSDVDLLQYQNLWSTEPSQIDYNSGHTSQQVNTYNNIGNILTNLELLGNNSNFDASNFEIITSNYEQQHVATQQQPLQQQQPQTQKMQPMQKTSGISHSRHHIHQQQPHQTMNHHHQQHPHNVIDTGGIMNDANMSYFDIQTAENGAMGSSNTGYSVQNIDSMGRSTIGYQNTITDISNTFLTENQRNNLQHVSGGSGGQFQQTHNLLASTSVPAPISIHAGNSLTSLGHTMPSLNDYMQ